MYSHIGDGYSSSSSSDQRPDSIIISLGEEKTMMSSSLTPLTRFPSTTEAPTQEESWILKHINGYATSGEMTAILGARWLWL